MQGASAQQFSAYGGLGVEYYKADGLSNYINYAAPGSLLPGSYTSAINFLVGGDAAVLKLWTIGIEYDYMIKTVNGSSSVGSQKVDISYSRRIPTYRSVFLPLISLYA